MTNTRGLGAEPNTDNASNVLELTVDDFEATARARLSAMAYDYYRSGADDEHTLRRNRAAFEHFELWYRTLVDVASPRTATTVLGSDVAFPILIAPTAYHLLAHHEGERATARAAARVGSLYCASTLATTSLEDVADASREVSAAAPKWFQLYVHKDRDFTAAMIARAKAAGYQAIAVTVDTPVLGRRCADVRNGFGLPPTMVMANLIEALPPDLRHGAGSELARFVASRHDAAFVWKDLVTIADLAAPLPVVVKGIARSDDAERALDHGAKAIWISNHGGRQLDLAPATIDVLPEVAPRLAKKSASAEIYVDGGIRSGTHALVALGLGARAVFVGRPILWGLATAGEEGVVRVLSLLRDELTRAMQLAGCPDLESARDDLVRSRSRHV